jgi:predicted dehydrogenase
VALIGCGAIGELRAQAVAQSPGWQLTAVADLDHARAAAFAAKHSTSAAAGWPALLARDDVDVVVLSTPPSSHAEIAMAALQSGKHVLCEKPLARTPAECRQMLDAAERGKRILATGFNYRFYPSVAKAREVFISGAIGELDHIRAYTGYSATAHHQAWLHDAAVMGGGTLRDNGIHLIDTVLHFFGDPVEVHGSVSGGVWGFAGCEDNGFALLRNAQGKIASLHASWTEWAGYRFQVELYGTKGCIRLRCFPMITEVVSGDPKSGKTARHTSYFPKVHFMEHLKGYQWVVVQSFIREFAELQSALAGKKSLVATGHDGWRAVDVAHRAAAGQGQRVFPAT